MAVRLDPCEHRGEQDFAFRSGSDAVADLLREWPSLADQLEYIHRFFGPEACDRSAAAKRDHFAKIRASQESASPGEPGGVVRFVETPRGSLFGRPYPALDSDEMAVDVWAHNFASLDDLAAAAAEAWAAISPEFLCLTRSPGRIRLRDSQIRSVVYSARCADMSAPVSPVDLVRFDGPDQAQRILEEFLDDPAALAAPGSTLPAVAELPRLHEDGELWAIHASGRIVGLLALSRRQADHIPALYSVEEKFVAPEYRGKGYASSALSVFAQQVAAADPSAVMSGTIHGLNLPSRRSAVRAGRIAVLEKVLVPLR